MTLSIIVPVYNVAPYLMACLKSIASAIDNLVSKVHGAEWNVEVICVDDGSTDGSSSILDEESIRLKAHGLKFIVIHQKNAGVSAARNAGLEIATGEWIGFVDADDTIDVRWFSSAIELIESETNADVVRLEPLISVTDCDCQISGCSGWLTREEAERRAGREQVVKLGVYRGDVACQWAYDRYSRYGWPVMNFIHRRLIGDLRFVSGLRLKEDVVFFVALSQRISFAVEGRFSGYFYTRRLGSAVMRHRKDDDSIGFVKAMLALVRDGTDSMLRRAVSVAIGYDFVQWAEERDDELPYNPTTCEILKIWKDAVNQGLIDISDMYWWWRIGIRHWLRTGDLTWAKKIRRTREWMGRFISRFL